MQLGFSSRNAVRGAPVCRFSQIGFRLFVGEGLPPARSLCPVPRAPCPVPRAPCPVPCTGRGVHVFEPHRCYAVFEGSSSRLYTT